MNTSPSTRKSTRREDAFLCLKHTRPNIPSHRNKTVSYISPSLQPPLHISFFPPEFSVPGIHDREFLQLLNEFVLQACPAYPLLLLPDGKYFLYPYVITFHPLTTLELVHSIILHPFPMLGSALPFHLQWSDSSSFFPGISDGGTGVTDFEDFQCGFDYFNPLVRAGRTDVVVVVVVVVDDVVVVITHSRKKQTERIVNFAN